MKRLIKQPENERSSRTRACVINPHLPVYESEQEPHQARIIALSPNKVSIDEMRAVWNDDEVEYSDTELFRIRDWFYTVTDVMLQTIADDEKHESNQTRKTKEPGQRKTKTIPFPNRASQSDKHEATEESHPLHPRIYRRAG